MLYPWSDVSLHPVNHITMEGISLDNRNDNI
jgi:hypothetical protein